MSVVLEYRVDIHLYNIPIYIIAQKGMLNYIIGLLVFNQRLNY